MSSESEELLLEVTSVKYRNGCSGRSPIGTLYIFKEHVEWKDDSSDEMLYVKFINIKGQRVSPPTKPKVQLQICMQDENQAIFVFLDNKLTREKLSEQRDLVKETLQQALLAHRQRVHQLAAANEKCSKSTELEEKKMILLKSKHLEQLYEHLVGSKLISPQEFWADYYKSTGQVEDKAGISGAFLANIAQMNGADGIKLNLNSEIIRAIFMTYPAVERKHLELVPHEMKESTFWSKFFQSHYYHREREVLPNPNDPFADCVRTDEADMDKLTEGGIARKRFDLDHLGDYAFSDFYSKPEQAKTQKTTLVRRCNYLSEKIVASTSSADQPSTSESNGQPPAGFEKLNSRLVEEVDSRLDSAELTDQLIVMDSQPVRLGPKHDVKPRSYTAEEAIKYKETVSNYLMSTSAQSLLNVDDSWMDFDDTGESNGHSNGTHDFYDVERSGSPAGPSKWGLSVTELSDLRAIHEAVAELLKHFWTCFPPMTPELEAKIDRMDSTLHTYEKGALANASLRFGSMNVQHCYDMIARAHARYKLFDQRRNK